MPSPGDNITVVLVSAKNARPGESRLVHTYMTTWPARVWFQANDDDRGEHAYVDEGITWVRGHVGEDSPEGRALLAAAVLGET